MGLLGLHKLKRKKVLGTRQDSEHMNNNKKGAVCSFVIKKMEGKKNPTNLQSDADVSALNSSHIMFSFANCD